MGRGLGVGLTRSQMETMGDVELLIVGVYSIVNKGGLALSRVSNRFADAPTDSSPNTSQPKLPSGLSSHDCTSATICGELHVYTPTAPTDWLPLTVPEKSPP